MSRPHTKPAPQPRPTPSHRNKLKQHFHRYPQQTIRFPRTRKTARESTAVAAPSRLTIRDRFESPLYRQSPSPPHRFGGRTLPLTAVPSAENASNSTYTKSQPDSSENTAQSAQRRSPHSPPPTPQPAHTHFHSEQSTSPALADSPETAPPHPASPAARIGAPSKPPTPPDTTNTKTAASPQAANGSRTGKPHRNALSWIELL